MFSINAPFIVTLLVAIISWGFTTAVERLSKTPYLVYDVNVSTDTASDESSIATISLQNINRSTTFHNLALVLSVPEGGVAKKIVVKPKEPASVGDNPSRWSGRTALHQFPVIQPGWSFIIELTYSGKGLPYVRGDINTSETIYLTKPNLETWFIQHDVEIIFTIWILAIVIIIVLVVSRFMGNLRSKTDQEPEATTAAISLTKSSLAVSLGENAVGLSSEKKG